MAKNNNLKAYVRYDGTGRIIPGSLILNRFKPAVGNWQETPAYECCNYTPVTVPALRFMFTDISFANGLVGDATNVNDWNTYLDLPALGTPFTSVIVTGNEVALYGGAGITLKTSAFEVVGKEDPSYLISVIDEGGLITELQDYVFLQQKLLTTVSLPQVVTIGSYSCNSCFLLTTILLPSCTNLGGTVLDNEVFNFIASNTISLTVPAALMTCNSGNPDGDIQYLQANNTVTITTT